MQFPDPPQMAPSTKGQILLVDDDPAVLRALVRLFEVDYTPLTAASGPESIERVRDNAEIAVVVMDIKMGGMDGIAAARAIKTIRSDLPIIFHTGYPGEYIEQDIDETEAPYDYIQKGRSVSKLVRSVRNAVELTLLKRNGGLLEDRAEADFGIIGRSACMQAVFRTILKTARSNTKVMILGETGTGKELVARAIHSSSRRRSERLGILNCNHKAPDLVESELFGHVRGAFTGAVTDRTGLFEFADAGTVFLDEIGDLDITTQGKLLRVLETGEYQKIGTPETRRVNVRLICATHRDLEEMVKAGEFREDLYFRLKGIQVHLPPLRERREDIPLLTEKFAARFTIEQGLRPKIFDQSAMSALIQYDWPGNVRQLLDTVESLIVLTDSEMIFGDDVARFLQIGDHDSVGPAMNLTSRLRAIERTYILQALSDTACNVSAAADLLGLNRSTLHKKLRAHAIDLDLLRD